jgi:hypothetical protein
LQKLTRLRTAPSNFGLTFRNTAAARLPAPTPALRK